MTAIELNELPFVHDTCDGCGVSYLEDGWMCVCELLIQEGNCPGCLYLPENCKCEREVRPTEICNSYELEMTE